MDTHDRGRREEARRHADRAQHRLDDRGRLPRHVHAGRVRARRDRAHAREERRPHDGDELPRLRRSASSASASSASACRWAASGPWRRFGGDATLSQRDRRELGGKAARPLRHERASCSLQLFTPAVATMFFFQMVFMDTTCTIPTGALAERWKFTSFVLFTFVDLDRHLPALRELGVGRRLAVARSARTSGSATATSTSPEPRSCT